MAAMIVVAMSTSARISEIEVMRVDRTDLESGEIDLYRTRTGQPRYALVSGIALRVLREYVAWRCPEPDGFLFAGLRASGGGACPGGCGRNRPRCSGTPSPLRSWRSVDRCSSHRPRISTRCPLRAAHLRLERLIVQVPDPKLVPARLPVPAVAPVDRQCQPRVLPNRRRLVDLHFLLEARIDRHPGVVLPGGKTELHVSAPSSPAAPSGV